MELCNIVSIYKGKGEKQDLKNDRGIFIVNIFRALIMKLVYKDKYEVVDESMSDSNVGGRKKKSIRNHIFILNGIINEALKNKNAPVDIVIVDYKQCFDSLWLEKCIITIQIVSILEEVCFGSFHFNVAMILRASLFLNSILTNCEAW